MHRFHPLSFIALVAALLLVVPARAQEPAATSSAATHYLFATAPPGTIMQTEVVDLAGQVMHGQWRAVLSRKQVGTQNGQSVYQWYLSIYAVDGTVYRVRYQSPGNGGPLSRVTHAAGNTKMWFPLQTVRIVGVAELMETGVQQLVVESHEMNADCGTSTVTAFMSNGKGNVVPAVTVRNGCALRATIARGNGKIRDAIVLSGPYYNKTAPMCCPTKAKASAVLTYRNGTWTQTPNYFEFHVGKVPAD
jgi:hypothetical protein